MRQQELDAIVLWRENRKLESQNEDLRKALKTLVVLCDKDLLLDPEVWSTTEIEAYDKAKALADSLEWIPTHTSEEIK